MPQAGARHPGGLKLAYTRSDGEDGLQLVAMPEEGDRALWKQLSVRDAARLAGELSAWVASRLRVEGEPK